MRLPNPYSLEETLGKLCYDLAAASNEGALTLLEKAITKARDDRVYAKRFEETLQQGSTIEIRECLSCFGDYFERSRDTPPYYPHHDAVNGIDCALYAILFDAAHPDTLQDHQSRTVDRPITFMPITFPPDHPDHPRQHHDPDIPIPPARPPHYRWPFAFQGAIPMSAFMIDRKDYLAFAVQLHRFCNAPMPPHYTLELLRTLWWLPPADTTSTCAWRVDRLARLMMLANRRAVWHRYQLGRQQDQKEPRQYRSTKLGPLKSAHRYHQAPLTDAELVALYKFTCSALYQSSEWTGSPEQAPRLVKVIQQLQQALAQDVLTRLSLWEQAPWGEM